MASATADVHGPVFSQADIGRRLDRLPGPGARGRARGFLAGRHRQLLAALLVTTIGAAYGLLLLPIAHLLPATVPIGLALLLLEWSADVRPRASRYSGTNSRPRICSSLCGLNSHRPFS